MAKNDDNGRGPDNIDIDKPVKTYNTSKSNTSSRTEIDGGGGPDDIDIEKPVKTYNTSKSNTSKVDGGGGGGPDDLAEGAYKCSTCGWNTCRCGKGHSCSNTSGKCPTCGKDRNDASPGEGGGGPDDIDIEKPVKTYNTSKSNTKAMHDGGDGPDPQMVKTYNTSKSNTSSRTEIDGGGGPDDIDIEKPVKTYNTSKSNTSSRTEIDGGGGGGGKQPARRQSSASGVDGLVERGVDNGGGGSGSGVVKRTVGKTLGMAKTVIMAAVLISVAGAGVDVYQTYNDAMEIDLEKHITDADFEMSDDKSEISGTVGFDIPEMGTFEKSIIASVHVTVLESNPTTDGDYEFEYKLGSGEQFYDFTLDDLDPVTVEKIEAGQPLDIEYSGTISVTYLGIEIPSVTMDIPLTTTTVETA